jgi:hypothetical protein
LEAVPDITLSYAVMEFTTERAHPPPHIHQVRPGNLAV